MSRPPRSQAHKHLSSVALLALGAAIATCAQTRSQTPTGSPTDGAAAVGALLLPTPAFASTGAGDHTVTVADVAEKSVASVVNISATKVLKERRPEFGPFFNDPFFRDFFQHRDLDSIPRERRQSSLGSGVIVSEDGVILTNNHVIEGAEEVQVSLSDGREFAAEIVGSDPKSDLAVLRLKGKVSDLRPLPLGDSSALRLGDVVLAIGNPFGVGQTVTMGIVSALGRGNMGIVDYEDFIQTDAAINPGNSGGALVNMRGELIGINTAILSRTGGYQGVGFAIPSNLVKPTMDSLLKDGVVVRGWLGVAIQDLDADLADGLGLDVKKGVLISDVTAGSPAARAGLQRGDVVVAIDGKPVATTNRLRNQISLAGPGSKVTLTLRRKSDEKTVEVVLGELPAELGGRSGGPPESQADLLGMSVGPLSDSLRQKYQIPASVDSGVVVTAIDGAGLAARAGLRPGDVIVEVNRHSVATPAQFTKMVGDKSDKLLFLVNRGGSTVYIVITR